MKFINSKEEFQKEVLEEKGTVLVDFFAEWCGPCKMMDPVLKDLAAANPELKIVEVNVDQAQELAMEYNVMSIPTIYIFKGGSAVNQMIGAQSLPALEQAIK